MRDKDILDSTRDFFAPKNSQIKGVKLHDRYSRPILIVGILLIAFSTPLTFVFDSRLFGVFGILLGLSAVLAEVGMKYVYNFNESAAVKYYALEMLDNPSKQNYKKLISWNKNPFHLRSEYHFPIIGSITENSKKKEDPVEYVSEEIADAIRIIERVESANFQVFIDTEEFQGEIDDYYEGLIQEINYSYKFGSYTSTAVLIRKLVENLLDEVLMTKGLYSEVSDEQSDTLSNRVDLFVEHVAKKEYRDATTERVEHVLDEVVRKKGNKSAHEPVRMDQEEVKEFVDQSRWVLHLLLEIHEGSETPSIKELKQNS